MDHAPQNLTQRDGELLNNLFALDQNLFSLAQHEQLPLHQLIAWSRQPHIQAAIDHITKLFEAGHKAAAIAHLRHTADTTKDPIERRRACTTLLRALTPSRCATDRGSARSVPPSNTTRNTPANHDPNRSPPSRDNDIQTSSASPPEGRTTLASGAAAEGGQPLVTDQPSIPAPQTPPPSGRTTLPPIEEVDPEVLALLPPDLRQILAAADPSPGRITQNLPRDPL